MRVYILLADNKIQGIFQTYNLALKKAKELLPEYYNLENLPKMREIIEENGFIDHFMYIKEYKVETED